MGMGMGRPRVNPREYLIFLSRAAWSDLYLEKPAGVFRLLRDTTVRTIDCSSLIAMFALRFLSGAAVLTQCVFAYTKES